MANQEDSVSPDMISVENFLYWLMLPCLAMQARREGLSRLHITIDKPNTLGSNQLDPLADDIDVTEEEYAQLRKTAEALYQVAQDITANYDNISQDVKVNIDALGEIVNWFQADSN